MNERWNKFSWPLPSRLGLALCLLGLGVSLCRADVVTFSEVAGRVIPDGDLTGTLVSMEVSGVPLGQGIRDLNVTLDIEGTFGFNGDLYAYLTKADNAGFTVLVNRPGKESLDSFGSAGAGFSRVVFDDEASNGDVHFYATQVGESALFGLPWEGVWQPDGRITDPALVVGTEPRLALLDEFDGVDPNGEWLLYLADVSPGGLLTLNLWTLEFEIDEPVSVFTGVASDGLVSGATVFFDADLSGDLEVPEPWVLTDGAGDYELTVLPDLFDQNGDGRLDASEGVLVLKGGTDIATGLPILTSMSAPVGASVIHPLTTLIAGLMARDLTLSAEEAEEQIEQALNLDSALAARVALLEFDIYAQAAVGNGDAVVILEAVARIQDTMVKVANFVGGANGVPIEQVGAAFVTRLVDEVAAGRSLSFYDPTWLQGQIEGLDGSLGNGLSPLEIEVGVEIILAGNHLKAEIAKGGMSVAEKIQQLVQAQVQIQGEIAGDLRALAEGNLSLSDAVVKNTFAELKAAVNFAPVGDLAGAANGVGEFEFDLPGYDVSESGFSLHPITVVRRNGNAGTVRLRITPNRGTADETDFNEAPIDIVFAPLEVRKTIDMAALIVNDLVPEGEEFMGLTLRLTAGNPVGAALGTQLITRLVLVDDDSPGVVDFAPGTAEIHENGRAIEPLILKRSAGNAGMLPVIVTFQESGGGATEGDDFIGEEVVVTFSPGSIRQRVIPRLIDDTLFEANETFRATLRLGPGAPPQAGLGPNAMAEVGIVSDDPNNPPTISEIPDQRILEDQVLDGLSFMVGDAEHAVTVLETRVSAINPALVAATGLEVSGEGATRQLTVRPLSNRNGTSEIIVEVDDGFDTSMRRFDLEVVAVNDPPELAPIADFEVMSGSGFVLRDYFVNDIDDAADSLTVNFLSLDEALLPSDAIESVGTGNNRSMRITVPQNADAVVSVRVSLSDGEFSVSRSFSIRFLPNDLAPPPNGSLMLEPIDDVAVLEDEDVLVPFVVTRTEASTGDLTFDLTVDNPDLVDVGDVVIVEENGVGTLSWTSLADQNGQVNVTLVVSDDSRTVGQSFGVSVTAVDDPPILGSGSTLELDEDGDERLVVTVSDVDTPLNDLEVVGIVADEAALFPEGSLTAVIGHDGVDVRVMPAANGFGQSIATLTVGDATTEVSTEIALVVLPVNDPPLLDFEDTLRMLESSSSSVAVTVADLETLPEELTVTARSLSPGLILDDGLSINGVGAERGVTVEPIVGEVGVGTIVLEVSDGEATISGELVVTVVSVDDPPVIGEIEPVELLEDGDVVVEFEISDPDTPLGSLRLTVSSGDTDLIPEDNLLALVEDGMGRVLLFPSPDASGMTSITVRLTDGLSTVMQEVPVTVLPVNDPPVVGDVADVVLEGGGEQVVSFEVNDIDDDFSDLVVSLTSSNDEVLPVNGIVVRGTEASREFTLGNAGGRSGETEIGIEVSDGDLAVVTVFRVQLLPDDPDPPVDPEPPLAAKLEIRALEGRLQIVWDEPGLLQQASLPTGPFETLPRAVSPYEFTPTTPGQAFFRVLSGVDLESPIPALMEIALEDGQIVIRWDGDGALYESSDPSGAFMEIEGATSPFEVVPGEPGSTGFYQVIEAEN